MQRAILLQTDPTGHKAEVIKRFSQESLSLANSLLEQRTNKRLMDLHKKTYLLSKQKTRFNSQAICDIERNVTKCKGTYLVDSPRGFEHLLLPDPPFKDLQDSKLSHFLQT